MNKSGFTFLETVITIAVLALLGGLAAIQYFDYAAFSRDNTRKSAINSMYYALEEVYYESRGYYPETISPSILPTVDESPWTDPSGIAFGETGCDYFYEPANCSQGRCRSYKLTAKLEKESEYLKTSE